MNRFIKSLAVALALAGAAIVPSGCSTLQPAYHHYVMRGEIVEITEKNVVVCVGTSDGARVGQELTAYNVVRTPVIRDGKNAVSWSRVRTGTVRIAELFDEHFANATVTAGSVDLHGIVELQAQ